MYSHNKTLKSGIIANASRAAYTVVRPKCNAAFPALQSSRILDQVRERIRYLHFSIRTEQAYLYWIRRFIRWSGVRHPREMGAEEVTAFLTFLASERKVSASTHRVALSSILFLYQKVLDIQLPWLDGLARPSVPRRLPVVLTREEVARILELLPGEHGIFARLLYGTGLRITEALQLRVKDVDFDHRAIVVREGKGFKDRVVMLPDAIVAPLRQQLAHARALWAHDRAAQSPGVYLPHAVEKKPLCGQDLGMVLGVSPSQRFNGPTLRNRAKASPLRPDLPTRFQACRAARRHRQTGHTAHIAPLLCNAPVAVRL